MRVRRWTVFIAYIFALIFVIYLFFSHMHTKILTNNVDKLERASVKLYTFPYDYSSPLIIEIDEKSMLNELYSIIKDTEKIKTIRNPRHSIVEGADPEYEIVFFYDNGKEDRFSTPEDPTYVYRVINNGYIIGKNKKLWDYVSKLQ